MDGVHRALLELGSGAEAQSSIPSAHGAKDIRLPAHPALTNQAAPLGLAVQTFIWGFIAQA